MNPYTGWRGHSQIATGSGSSLQLFFAMDLTMLSDSDAASCCALRKVSCSLDDERIAMVITPPSLIDTLAFWRTHEGSHLGGDQSLASTLVFVWIFTHGVAQATVVPSESMTPTILVGDHFFLDKVAFPANYPQIMQNYLPARTINRGDIIAFWSPENPEMRLVKRVIGLPGETIEIRNRDVYINGRRLDEPYAVHTDVREIDRRDTLESVMIPPDHFFMMGDNRDNSNDSRFWGFAPRESFIGKPLFVYWS